MSIKAGIRLRLLGRAAPALAAVLLSGVCAHGFVQDRQLDPCESNLRKYAIGLMMYVSDYDERFPPMKFPAQVKNRVRPYVRNESLFTCPVTRTDYLPDPTLNYSTATYAITPKPRMMFRDDRPHREEGRPAYWNVVDADYKVTRTEVEPKLGKPAPTPPPPTRREQIEYELKWLRRERKRLNDEIWALENEQRRLRRR